MSFTLATAISIAATAHARQTDKAGMPYIFHPLRVMMDISLRTEEERIVAVLHDVIEDTKVTENFLRSAGCPEPLLRWLDFLTKRQKEQKDYDLYIQRISSAPSPAIRIKIADLKHNKDLSRFTHPTEKDINRAHKYERAYHTLSLVLESRESRE